MNAKRPVQPAPIERPRPNPLPPNTVDPSPSRIPDDVPTWKPDYSELTK